MEDVLQRFPLLLLPTLLLLVVVLFHVRVVVRGPRGRRKRQSPNMRKTTMDRREASNRQPAHAIEYSASGAMAGARLAGAYDPTLYSHLPPHEQPLPPDAEEQWVDDMSRTLPLGSGSTQEWMGSHCRQREAMTSCHSFSALLEDDVGGGDTEIVDLDFGLSSGSGPTATHTRTFNPVPGATVGRLSVHGGRSSPQGVSPDGCRPPPPFSWGAGSSSDMLRTSLPPPLASPLSAPRQTMGAPVANTNVAGSDKVGRGRGGGVRQGKDVSRGGRSSNGSSGEKAGKHPSWSVEEMLKLAWAKRDQQAHFEVMPHNYGRMHNREWKLQDLQKRLLEVGVDRTTDDIGKKWDNLFQQYKKVQRYENASGGKNFLNLTPALRTEEGFNFRISE
ncbi:hypothetical protein CBR_g95 [Chara braunii]|uniref:Myb/SANT-like DNA-binding domain-containing protein n=1 Tax=Chara braunii TaxID=69332 RepID=A0A388JLK8_CHABU|nr:hypothetical protein CBR_g95 [Chara braunii]|eukprot:GBG58694.1 hypothetical protein CBR_g95 [Chara braunii]